MSKLENNVTKLVADSRQELTAARFACMLSHPAFEGREDKLPDASHLPDATIFVFAGHQAIDGATGLA